MPIEYSSPFSEADSDRRLKDFIKALEAEKELPYVDNAKRGNPTIGWGFALIRPNVNVAGLQFLIRRILGVDFDRSELSPSGKARERYYENELVKVLNQHWLPDTTGTETGPSTIALRSQLNEVLAARAAKVISAGFDGIPYAYDDLAVIGEPRLYRGGPGKSDRGLGEGSALMCAVPT